MVWLAHSCLIGVLRLLVTSRLTLHACSVGRQLSALTLWAITFLERFSRQCHTPLSERSLIQPFQRRRGLVSPLSGTVQCKFEQRSILFGKTKFRIRKILFFSLIRRISHSQKQVGLTGIPSLLSSDGIIRMHSFVECKLAFFVNTIISKSLKQEQYLQGPTEKQNNLIWWLKSLHKLNCPTWRNKV